MKFRPGENAPHFAKQDLDGGSFDLAEVTQKKRVWLAFFRFVSCPMCNLRLHQLASAWPRMRHDDVEMVVVYQSPPESVKEWVNKNRPPIRIISDPDLELYHRYGVETSILGSLRPEPLLAMVKAKRLGIPFDGPVEGPKTRVPADFLIERGGIVKDAYYGKHIADHIPLKRVSRFLESTRANASPFQPVRAR